MATYTIDEAIGRIRGYLDRVAAEAETFMKGYIENNANQGYQTGALSSSINVERVNENTRSVGTSLKSKTSDRVYGEFVDKGRGPISKEGGYLRYYDRKLGKWIRTKHVKGMSGIYFIRATKTHLENAHIPL